MSYGSATIDERLRTDESSTEGEATKRKLIGDMSIRKQHINRVIMGNTEEGESSIDENS